ncbi:hypothetical protein [Plastoroseomonas hellenica]|uniref:hypothetical protein n=1 Tax=Plastoroseomonas hellenica TaxID=2687306 RepID=UPI001BAE3A2A|nr:hypothetical protein [Plastoroseomonas hellenica]MBR0643997.1 hypothetical protein [Plastoroseomonas hellenica]
MTILNADDLRRICRTDDLAAGDLITWGVGGGKQAWGIWYIDHVQQGAIHVNAANTGQLIDKKLMPDLVLRITGLATMKVKVDAAGWRVSAPAVRPDGAVHAYFEGKQLIGFYLPVWWVDGDKKVEFLKHIPFPPGANYELPHGSSDDDAKPPERGTPVWYWVGLPQLVFDEEEPPALV